MSRTQFAVTLAVVAVAGLLGGSLTDWLRPAPAHAQRGAREVIRAWRLEIVDEAGKVRVSLGVGPQSAGIAINDEEGRARLGLTYQSNGRSTVGFGDEDERSRMLIFHHAAEDDTGIRIFDGGGNACLDVGQGADGAFVALRNQPAKTRVLLLAKPDAEAGLEVFDEAGTGRLELSESPEVGTRLTLADDAGNNRITLNCEGSGEPAAIAIADQAQTPRIGLMHMAGRPAEISVWDEDGNQKQLAP